MRFPSSDTCSQAVCFYTLITCDEQTLIYLRYQSEYDTKVEKMSCGQMTYFNLFQSISYIQAAYQPLRCWVRMSAGRKDAENRLKSGEWSLSFHPAARVRTFIYLFFKIFDNWMVMFQSPTKWSSVQNPLPFHYDAWRSSMSIGNVTMDWWSDYDKLW